MFLFRSIKAKILFFTGLCLVFSLMAVIGYSTYSARERAVENAVQAAADKAYIEALGIKGRVDAGLVAARSITHLLEGYKRDTSGTPERSQVMQMLYEVVASESDLLGAWTGWEPDAFDGRDADFKGVEGSKADGRFAPYCNRAGGLHVQTVIQGFNSGKWYKLPIQRDAETIINPIRGTISGRQVILMSLAAPIKVDGKVLGVAGVDVDGDFLQELSDTIELFGHKADVTLVTHTGMVTGKTGSPQSMGKDFSAFEPDARDILRRNHNGETVSFFRDGRMYIYVPVEMGETGAYWTVGLSVDDAVIYEKADAMAVQMTAIGGGCLLLALIILWLLAGRLARPIQQTAHAVNAIADGKLDTRLAAEGGDEVAEMQGAVNVMAEKMQQNIADIESQMAVARDKTVEAEKAMREAEEARVQAEHAKAEGMMQAAEKLERVVERISTAMEEISAQSEEVRRGTDVQKDRIQATATAMEEMNATVLEVAQNAGDAASQGDEARATARKGEEVVGKSIEAMAATQHQTEMLRVAMNDLETKARSIGNIINVIEDIADQTNLLALNAAIEAARAGDAGRGFAVVADEVRKLAEKTMMATKEVGSSILAIQKVTEQNVVSMEKAGGELTRAVEFANTSGDVLREIVSGVEASAGQIQGIATAAGQQSAASDEINRSIDEINSITADTAQSIEETVLALREMAEQSSGLAGLIQELKTDASKTR